MRIIAVEEHYADQRIIDENIRCAASPNNTGLPPELAKKYEAMRYGNERLMEVGRERLAFMDTHGVDVQVLSYTAPVDDTVPAADAVRICRQANDILAEVVASSPKRFAAFATLPMADPDAAAAELRRCVREYGFVGALITGTYKNRFYDSPEFFCIFKEAAELDVPISWHPDFPDPKILTHYFLSDNYPQLTGMQFATVGFGWHLDVGLHMARVILSGIFDKLPTLRFISGHWGETIPAFLDRMDQIMRMDTTGLKKPISDYYHENVYFTPSGILSRGQFDYFLREFGADRIIWALDYPYVHFDHSSAAFLIEADIPQADKELIAHGNAERLLRL